MLLTLDGVKQIVSVNEGNTTGHDPSNGNVLWETPWASKSNGDACASQPVAVDDKRILLSKGYALGSKMIQVSRIEGKAEYDPQGWSVETLWSNIKVLKTKFTSAVFFEGSLFALSDGVLECVDPGTGERRWRGGRYGQGQMIIVNGHILIMAEDGRIVLVQASSESTSGGKAPKEIAQIPVLEGITWNVPTVAGPYLLIRNGEQVACLLSQKDVASDEPSSQPKSQQ
jgi:outer membrane protein assembly factor BamB